MKKFLVSALGVLLPLILFSQGSALRDLLADPVMQHASVSYCLMDPNSDSVTAEFNSEKSLIPASVFKIITTSAALELLGPGHIFKTTVGYTGTLIKGSGLLTGDIIIKGGGDPVLGSDSFPDTYSGFIDRWVTAIKNLEIKSITGSVITDDSYFDYLPVPGKWLWEDEGNYYGAGAYGLSVFDNTYDIHFKTSSDGTIPVITGITRETGTDLTNRLIAAGTTDRGFVFAAPYSKIGWLAGSIPANADDFILKAALPDPPMTMAQAVDKKLRSAGIIIKGQPATTRILNISLPDSALTPVISTVSPPLKEIIKVLNKNSVNLYSEHLLKELGKAYGNDGSAGSGIEVLYRFLASTGLDTGSIFIEDGSGLSTFDAVDAGTIANLLCYMKNKGNYFNDFYASLPLAGAEGTLKRWFRDPVFSSRIKAKSGSMTRVRSYAGYITTLSGNDLVFCIIINNYLGPPDHTVHLIENILKEVILYK